MKLKKCDIFFHHQFCPELGPGPCRCQYWAIVGVPSSAMSKENVARARNAKVERQRRRRRRR